MRLLLLGLEVSDLSRVRNFSGVYSYFLTRALREAGAEVVFADPPPSAAAYLLLELHGIDHILGMHSRHFDRAPDGCLVVLRGRFQGAVTQLSDRPLANQLVDCTFTARADRGTPGNYCVGWAADPDVCRPAQWPGELMILIDHPDYVSARRWDRTAEVKRQVREFMAARSLWADRFDRVIAFEIADGSIAEWDLVTERPFSRQHIPYLEACVAYGRSSLYMVTHRESLGLTVLETSLCGALPVAPRGFIQPDRLSTVRHVEYADVIDWPAVLDAIDVQASRDTAVANSWAAVAGRMLEWFRSFNRKTEGHPKAPSPMPDRALPRLAGPRRT